MRVQRFRVLISRLVLLSTTSSMVFTNTGCNPGTMSTMSSEAGSPQSILNAQVMGGRKPISGAAVVLAEAGTSGKGSSTVLASTTSDSKGNFNINSFTCQHQSSQVYITASGGDAGNGDNSNIFLIAMLGPCNKLPNFVVINELSTVAAAYAFSQFMNSRDPSQIGTDGTPGTTQYIGITNAGATLAMNLVNIPGGTPSATLSRGLNSPKTINTLADILVYCVNAPSPYTNCDTLFSSVPVPSGGSAPTNTLQAALDIALGPGQNVATIFGLLAQVSVALTYTPALTAAPNDWLLGLNFNPGDLSGIDFIAIDQAGNVWITNGTTNTVSELSPIGVELSPAGGYTGGGALNDPFGIFIDATGNIWITNQIGNTVEAMDSSGNTVVGPFGSSSTYDNPSGVVLDSFGQVWVTNWAGGANNISRDVTVTTTSGVFSFFNGTRANGAFDLMADTTVSPNIIWVSHTGTGGVARIVDDGTSRITVNSVPGNGQSLQFALAIDNNGDCWVTNTGNITKLSNTTPPKIVLTIKGGGIDDTSNPEGISIDSANDIWVLNDNTNTVTELDTDGNALSPTTGFNAGGLINSVHFGLAIDRSGDVWVANAASMTELVGAAAPVATPLFRGRPIAP